MLKAGKGNIFLKLKRTAVASVRRLKKEFMIGLVLFLHPDYIIPGFFGQTGRIFFQVAHAPVVSRQGQLLIALVAVQKPA